ncbi:MAG: TlpA disulfide reductase family protein [Parabacteroides sp.]|nr:TlpA disulfide reductase family protein [Parabacteroides sp.]
MRKFIIIFCLGVIFSSESFSSLNNGKFRINGTISKSFDGQMAILSIKDDYQKTTRSDTSIINTGNFSFAGNEYLDNLSSIIIEDKYGIKTRPELDLLLESGTISVSFDKDQPCMEGSPLNNIFMEYLDSTSFYRAEIAKIEPKWENEIVIIPDTELERLYYAQGEFMMNFTKQNFSNPLGKALFMKNLDVGVISTSLYLAVCEKKLDEIVDFVDKETRLHPRFTSLYSTMHKVKAAPVLIGMKVENFSLLTPKGNTVQLSEYLGKKDFVFLEFWASWCGPCLATIPKLKELYTEYSDNLEIVSISMDTKQASWTNALNQQNMPWPQFADLNGFESDIAKTFKIKGIPFGLLIDKQGFVVANIRGALALKLFLQNKLRQTT